MLILRRPLVGQPAGIPVVSSSYADKLQTLAVPVGGDIPQSVVGARWSILEGTPTGSVGTDGVALETNTAVATSWDTGVPDTSALSLFNANGLTLVIRFQKTDAVNRGAVLFANNADIRLHAPYSDGVTYFDYRGFTSGVTRIQVSGLDYSKPVTLVCSAGPRGMSITHNGIVVASHVTAASGSAPAGTNFRVGRESGNLTDSNKIYLVGLWNKQFPIDSDIAVSADVYGSLFEPRRIYIPISSATGPASHDATGALSAQAATIAGTAADVATYTSTGALSAQSATVAGTAAHLTLHTSSGALAADAATVAGTAAHTTTGTHAASGALAADAATVAGTAAHLTLHAATGALVADAATVSGTARDETTYVPPKASTAAGRSSRKQRRRVAVEIDGEEFIVESEEEAEALLDQAKAEAEKLAQVAIERAVRAEKRAPKKVIKDAQKALVVPEIKAPGLEDYASDVLRQIRESYASAMQTIEVSALFRKREREEEDDEDVLMLIA